MSKKMKGVALESSIHGSFIYKNQRLTHDYKELEKETEAAKNKLEVMKQRKLTLLAEVRFLRQRRAHLLQMKVENPHERNGNKEIKFQNNASIRGLNKKEKGSSSKKAALKVKDCYVNQKEKKNNGKDPSFGNKNIGFNKNQKERKYCSKEATFKHPSEVLHMKQKERLFVEKEANFPKKNLGFDLNQMEKSYAVREPKQNKAPVFDLNLKLGEEEDLQESYNTSKCEEPSNIFSNGNEEQLNDLKLSICRNVESVPSRSGKRKISWQDPVALKV